MPGLGWEVSKAFLWPPCFSSKGLCCVTSDMQGQERLGKGLNCMTNNMKDQGLNHVTSNMLGEEMAPWEQSPTLQYLSSLFCPLLSTGGFPPW